MTRQPYWAIAPLEHVAYCNAFAESNGWGANNLRLRMSPTGLELATHLGCHVGALLPTPLEGSTEASAASLNGILAGKAELFPATDSPYEALEAKGLKIIPLAGSLHDA